MVGMCVGWDFTTISNYYYGTSTAEGAHGDTAQDFAKDHLPALFLSFRAKPPGHYLNRPLNAFVKFVWTSLSFPLKDGKVLGAIPPPPDQPMSPAKKGRTAASGLWEINIENGADVEMSDVGTQRAPETSQGRRRVGTAPGTWC